MSGVAVRAVFFGRLGLTCPRFVPCPRTRTTDIRAGAGSWCGAHAPLGITLAAGGGGGGCRFTAVAVHAPPSGIFISLIPFLAVSRQRAGRSGAATDRRQCLWVLSFLCFLPAWSFFPSPPCSLLSSFSTFCLRADVSAACRVN